MTDDIVELVKERNPIEDVIAEDGFPLPQRGRYRKCRTPGTGGLVVDVMRQYYSWNARAEYGDVIAWVCKQHKMDFKGAVEWLAARAGLPAPDWGHTDPAERAVTRAKEDAFEVAARVFAQWLEASPAATAYVQGRGWTSWGETDEDGDRRAGTIQRARLGFSGDGSDKEKAELRQALAAAGVDLASPAAVALLGYSGPVAEWAKAHNINPAEMNEDWLLNGHIPGLVGRRRLVYPHIRGGRVVYLSARSIEGKYHYNLPEVLVGRKHVYLNHQYGPASDLVVVVEGQADAVSLGQWGIDAIALAGVAAGDEGLGAMLAKHKAVYVGLDADEAGRKNAWKVAEAIGPLTRLVSWQTTGAFHYWADSDGVQHEIKDANDLLRSMCRQDRPVEHDEQCKFVRRVIEQAGTYVEAMCAWAGGTDGAERDEAIQTALGVVLQMDDVRRSQYRSGLAKALGGGVRDFDHMLKTMEQTKAKSNASQVSIETLGGPIGEYLVEYLYDPDSGIAQLAWRDPDGQIHSGDAVEIDGTRYVPMAPSMIITTGGVLFPSRLGPLKDTRELVAYIEMYIRSVYLLPRVTDAKIMAYYALLTWLYDCFNTIPYLRAMGEAGAGKSELMRRVGLVCYRLMTSSGAGSSASLFHGVEQYRGTVFVDEADLKDSDTTNDVVKFLNLGAMKNNPIWRLEEITLADGRKGFAVKIYQTFCPKLIAMRRDFRDDAVGSRCITFKIQPMEPREIFEAGVTLEITNEIRGRATALRNMLLRWRLEHWQREIEIDPMFYDLDISSRLNQVTGPLMAIAKDDPDLQAEMRQFLREYYAEMVLSRSMTITARVIEAMWKIYRYPDLRKEMVVCETDGDERILVGNVTRIANEIMDEMNGRDEDDEKKRARDELSPHKIGKVLREEMQLRSMRSNKGYWVYWNQSRMEAMAKRYGIDPDEIAAGAARAVEGDGSTNGRKGMSAAQPRQERLDVE